METPGAARRTTPPPMAARPLFILFHLAVSSCAAAGTGTLVVGEDYVRPPAGGHRKALLSLFPWSKKKTSYSASDPQQVHISLAGEKHIRITWITDDNSVPSFVDYGTKAGTYTSTSQGESTSYTYLMYSSGKIHHVVIGPLEDNTVYYYRCGGQGPEFQFKTPPSQFPLSLAVGGDLGQTSWTTSTLNHIKQCEYDILLLPGDLSYADYMQHLWDSFGKLVEPLASTHPWMVTEGNHEKEHIPFFKSGFQSYNARWKMPYEESGSTSNLYYSFDVAGAHIVMLGSYMDYDENSDQYAWLKKENTVAHCQQDSPSLSVSLAPKLESAVEAPPNAGNDASPLQVSGFAESAVDVGANAAHNTCVQQGSPSVARHYPNPGRNANNHVLRRQHIPEVRNHGDRPTGFNNLVLKAQDRAAAARGFLLPNDSRNSGNVKGKPRVVNETTGENSKNTTKFCGSKGHVAHKCRTAKHLVELYLKSRKEKEANQKCYRCGTMGHLSQMSHAKTPR